MFEKWKEVLDNARSCGVLLVNPSNDFDCIAPDLFLEKLNTYGSGYNSLKLINSLLSDKNV